MRSILIFGINLFIFFHLHGQNTPGPKQKFYAGIGYHRSFYSASKIHFRDNKTANYDFTLYRVKAKDVKGLKIGKGVEAPQFTIEAGYYFNAKKGWGVELNYDHAKYKVVQDQAVRIDGQINGERMNKDTVLSKDFIQYEHTHGANHFMVNAVKETPFYKSKNRKHFLAVVFKPGAGIAIPHTNSTILGKHRDDQYNVAGFIIGFETALRYEFLKYFFVSTSLKATYAHYSSVLLYGEGRANQHWFGLQPVVVVGGQL